MATVAAAYPFIEVFIDTSQLTPVAQRAPGVIAIVGSTAGGGTAPVNVPLPVESAADAATLFANRSTTR
jgi:phage tail sheath gpL-like